MYRLTDLLVKRIAEAGAKSDKGVLINHWMTCFVFDLMGEISYSKSYGCLDSGEVHQAINELDKFMAAGAIFQTLPWLVRIMTSIPGAPTPMKGLQDFATASLAERKKSKIQSPDVLSYVFQGKIALTHEEEIEDTIMLQIAGSDTTKSVLIFILYHLAINPEIQSVLRKEIETLASVDLHCEELQDLPLLESVVNETLRVHPAVPSGLPRLTPPEGIQVGDTYIPGNTTVSCPTWTIQHG
jgi:tryprostatin B 6-hydroxylase